ncbi:hypothetical protein B0H19DRAFT_946334, partial [Mycena capillaripes]
GQRGKHLWPLLQEVLSKSRLKGMITANMAKVPRWPGLKHFENFTSKDINDGQSWLDIEKCILPCVVQLLPKNSPFVHAIRTHLLTRRMMEVLMMFKKLTDEYDKSFDFPKQHALYHSTPDIRNKGPHSISCTRVNEGFHQECREIYARRSKRDLDKQGGNINKCAMRD